MVDAVQQAIGVVGSRFAECMASEVEEILLRIIHVSSLVKSYPSIFSKVSPSHAGQVVSILKLSPGR